MLLNDFFRILNISDQEEKKIIQIELEKNHRIYEGHFPGNPVVPGVCLIRMVHEIIELIHSQKLLLITAVEIKFLNIVNPLMTNSLTIEVKQRTGSENSLSFNVLIYDDEKIFLKMRGEWKVAVISV